MCRLARARSVSISSLPPSEIDFAGASNTDRICLYLAIDALDEQSRSMEMNRAAVPVEPPPSNDDRAASRRLASSDELRLIVVILDAPFDGAHTAVTGLLDLKDNNVARSRVSKGLVTSPENSTAANMELTMIPQVEENISIFIFALDETIILGAELDYRADKNSRHAFFSQVTFYSRQCIILYFINIVKPSIEMVMS